MASLAEDISKRMRLEDVRGKRLLIALSGGADSVALACLLAQFCGEYGISLCAAHLNHGIRGAEADGDAAYCRELCRELDVELLEARVDVPALAAERGMGLESAAREARYSYLYAARDACNADFIALAHHQDDQAETVLMHLLRGAGPEGVTGMHRFSGALFRPLLEVSRAELRRYLEERETPWREDSTNAVSDNPRNALRLHALPAIEQSYPGCAAAIARYARLAKIESDCLSRMTDAFMKRHVQRGPYGARILLDAATDVDEAILRRAMRRLCGDALNADRLDALVALSRKKRGRLSLTGRLSAEKCPGALYFLQNGAPSTAQLALALPGESTLDGICHLVITEGDFAICSDDPMTEVLDGDALLGAVLRTRRDGDRIRPLGSGGSRLLSDYLTDKKVDRPLRDCLPVIAKGKDVLWVGGVGIAEDAAVKKDTARRMRIRLYGACEQDAEVR